MHESSNKKQKKNRSKLPIDLIRKAAQFLPGEMLDKELWKRHKLHDVVRKKYSHSKTETVCKDYQWQIDIAYMRDIKECNYQLQYIFCVIHVYSRYAWVRMLKNLIQY